VRPHVPALPIEPSASHLDTEPGHDGGLFKLPGRAGLPIRETGTTLTWDRRVPDRKRPAMCSMRYANSRSIEPTRLRWDHHGAASDRPKRPHRTDRTAPADGSRAGWSTWSTRASNRIDDLYVNLRAVERCLTRRLDVVDARTGRVRRAALPPPRCHILRRAGVLAAVVAPGQPEARRSGCRWWRAPRRISAKRGGEFRRRRLRARRKLWAVVQ